MPLNINEFLSYFDYFEGAVAAEAIIVAPEDQLLSQARMGSVVHLRSLTRAVLQSGRAVNITIVDIFKELVLSQPTPEIIEVSSGLSKDVRQTELAVHCIFLSADLLTRTQTWKQVGKSLLPHWDAMVVWVGFIVKDLSELLGPDKAQVRKLVRCSAIILAKVAWAGSWPARLFRSGGAAEAIISLWCFLDADGLPIFISSLMERTGCPIISLFENRCLQNKDTALSKLQEQTGDSLKATFHFASGRLKSLKQRLASKRMTVLCATSDVRSIWKIILRMIEHGPNKQIYDAMIQFKVFRRMVQSLNEVTKSAISLPHGYNHNEGPKSALYASETMGEVMFGMMLSTQTSRAIAQGIYGGLHQYLIRHFLPHASTTTLQYRMLLDAYKSISLHGIYPAVRKATVFSQDIPGEVGINKLKTRFPDFKEVFYMLDYANREPIRKEEHVKYLKQLCDSPMQGKTSGLSKMTKRPKPALAVGHWTECKVFKEAEESILISPSISKRAELLIFVEDTCNEAYFEIMQTPRLTNAQVPVFSIDGTEAEIMLSGLLPTTFWANQVAAENAIYSRKEYRVLSFFNEAQNDPTIKLAEGIFLAT
ncbi:hypothetical protein EST38_g14192 [Candolleomyces aberdarensis]|uniref:Uncharacterized protein n=1 Tax=Candolleomyces aberdarensis TaxID=2316362 RepID=A0A4Q2CY15_9AGAR|nr:hypothetical protein EST38_g14192 [Candolleomyces aberdarensis]